MSTTKLTYETIMRDMAQGIIIIDLDGAITYANPAAARILGHSEQELVGQSFARCSFCFEGNASFNQTMLDAVFSAAPSYREIIPYFTGERFKQLYVSTSHLKNDNGEKQGIIAALSDVSGIVELGNTAEAIEYIHGLNKKLEMRNNLLSDTFGRFLSDEIVHQLLETPNGLEMGGKKRFLTILMSDLRGFTALSERMEPHALLAMLNHYFGEMTEIIQQRNGTIIEFMGDAIVAVFGAPLASDCHASEAVAAAVEMQAKMEAVNRWNLQRGYPRLEMGIGINTGDVIIGNIGSEKRTKYGVVGKNANLCGRIESYTVGGQILISPQTRELIGEPLAVDKELVVFPKGIEAPLVLTNVMGIGGKYGLSCQPQDDETLMPLATPYKVDFYIIKGKHSDLEANRGIITALSPREAILETSAAIEEYDNLHLEIGAKLFCKVTAGEERGWRLRFTAIPPEFDAWYKERIKS